MSKLHTRCGEAISFDEVTAGYYAQCPTCDEDLYSFEVESAEVKCANCDQELEQLTDGQEWVADNGSIFCEITDEIHNRKVSK